VSAGQDRRADRRLRAQEVGLFRYGLIADALDPGLTTKQRGRLVREIAGRVHPGPMWTPTRVSRASLDRWIRAHRAGGFQALVPAARRPVPQTPAEVLELAAALKKEAPGRTAAQVAVVLAAHAGFSPSARTLQRHFAALGLNRLTADGTLPAVFGRFEARRPTPAGSATGCTARWWPAARRS
jgi:transposase